MSSLKLEFMTEEMEYLRPVLMETRTGEETAESIIPDSTPDISEVLFTCGTAFLRGQELMEGRASVSAGVSASVLLQPEGQAEPEVIEAYLPISLTFENSAIHSDLRGASTVFLERLESQLVNPRRILIRASVRVTLKLWEPCREEHPVSADAPGVETLLEVQPARLLSAMGEKRYSVEDTVRFPSEHVGKKLVSVQTQVEHSECRLTGTRAVFRGNLELSALYLTHNGKLETADAQLPFSQFIDLETCEERDELQLDSILCGADAELSADGGGLNISAQILSRAAVWSSRDIPCITDVYSCDGQAEPQWREREYESLLDTQLFPVSGRAVLSDITGQEAAAVCLPGVWIQKREGEHVSFTLPVRIQLLTDGETGASPGTARIELTCATRAAPGCRFELEATELHVQTSPGAEGSDVRLSGTLCLRTYGTTSFREVSECEITEDETAGARPGLIIRRTCRGERLWDIAKQYGSTREAIRSANSLTEEPAEGTLLLIPGR